MLVIRADVVDAMVAHARADHPDEACGILPGPEGSDRPERHVAMVNAERSPTFYRFDAQEQLAVAHAALGIAAIYRLRRLRPEMPRPYKVVGYPIVPAIFIVSVAAFFVNALIHEPIPTAITFALILAGLPVYHFAFARR